MTGIQFEPLDTLFFRDGTPFSAGSASQDDVGGLFPPPPVSVAGALRAALARQNGWNGTGRWPPALTEVLGSGPDDLGKLSLSGPFLLRDGQPLFPVPRHLVGCVDSGRWQPRGFLRPGAPVACDLGEAVRLPALPPLDTEPAELKPGDGWWLTRTGLEAALRGEIPQPADLVASGDLWHEERRLGLERNDATRTAEEGMLYGTRHVRPDSGVGLGLLLAGVPRSWSLPLDIVVPLGGEGRLAESRVWNEPMTLAMPLESVSETGRVAVVALTPLDLDEDVCLGRSGFAEWGGARVISACLARPQRVGGWDSLARRPLPLRSLLPAGSTLFCELEDPAGAREAIAKTGGLPRLGARQQWGFGVVALGAWSEAGEGES